MPYNDKAAALLAVPSLKGLDDKAPLTLAQINAIMHIYDTVKASNPTGAMAVAIASFKRFHAVVDGKWVRKETKTLEISDTGSAYVVLLQPTFAFSTNTERHSYNWKEGDTGVEIGMRRNMSTKTWDVVTLNFGKSAFATEATVTEWITRNWKDDISHNEYLRKFLKYLNKGDGGVMIKATQEERDKLKTAQAARAKRYGIAVKNPTYLTPPTGYPTDESAYGDPVNYAYPLTPIERCRNALARFAQNREAYSTAEQKVIWNRIVAAALKFDIAHVYDAENPLDQMLEPKNRMTPSSKTYDFGEGKAFTFGVNADREANGLVKVYQESDGKQYLMGTAANTLLDKEDEEMAPEFIKKMKDSATGLTCFYEHQHDIGHTLGKIIETWGDSSKFGIKVILERAWSDENPVGNRLVAEILEKTSQGTNIGFSIGGRVTRAEVIFDPALGRKKRRILDGNIYEISATAAPCLNDLGWAQVVSKSISGDTEGAMDKNDETPAVDIAGMTIAEVLKNLEAMRLTGAEVNTTPEFAKYGPTDAETIQDVNAANEMGENMREVFWAFCTAQSNILANADYDTKVKNSKIIALVDEMAVEMKNIIADALSVPTSAESKGGGQTMDEVEKKAMQDQIDAMKKSLDEALEANKNIGKTVAAEMVKMLAGTQEPVKPQTIAEAGMTVSDLNKTVAEAVKAGLAEVITVVDAKIKAIPTAEVPERKGVQDINGKPLEGEANFTKTGKIGNLTQEEFKDLDRDTKLKMLAIAMKEQLLKSGFRPSD